MIVALLNLVGLALTVVAAFMMWLFPPRMAYYTEKGEQIITWTNNAQSQFERIGKWQTLLSKWAPLILAIGFGLQLPSAILSVCQAT